MAKKNTNKTVYVCTDCGSEYLQWQGQCNDCQAWETIKELKLGAAKPADRRRSGFAGQLSTVKQLDEVDVGELPRFSSGIGELDRVLGGGFVPGSVVLLGGSPGAGKSTILLQSLCYAAQNMSALYVSGEESLEQIAGRARRLGLPSQLKLVTETSSEAIVEIAEQEKPQIMVVDSIQTLHLSDIDGAPGGVSQVRECAAYLTQYAKQSGTTLLLVGHVTKDNSLAGPMTLSHVVDTQLLLESNTDARYRFLRSSKNRFGAVNELGVFAMTDMGLKEVKNPSSIFLNKDENPTSGSIVNVLWEGTRPLLVEIQALVNESQSGQSRRICVGFDTNRLIMLLAVLSRHGHLFTADQDVFLNVVGGVKVTETSGDLAILLACVSSFKDTPLPAELLAFGEVGLNGEIRPVANGQERIKEAVKHGFSKLIVPKANLPKKAYPEAQLIGVSTLSEAIEAIC